MNHQGHDYTQSYIQAVLYIGIFAMLGAGFFARYVGREVAKVQAWRLWYLLSLGFIAALGATVYGSYHAVWMLGDTSLLLAYWTDTSQGNLLAARAVLMLALLGLSLGWARFDRWVWPPLALALLLTTHAGAKGPALYLTDLVHLGAGVAWAGSLLALSLTWPGTRFEAVRTALERLSAVGLVSLGVVSLAGTVLAVVHLGTFNSLFTTPYGRNLLFKLGAVAAVIALAGINRFWLLPRYRVKGAQGLGTVSLEALLVLGVLALSGLLASTEPPGPIAAQGVAPSSVDIEEDAGEHHYSGQLYAEVGQVYFLFDIKDKTGRILPKGGEIPVRFVKDGEAIERTAQPFQNAQYHTTFQVPPGTYEVTLAFPDDTLEYTIAVPAK
ncbi:MAG: copper resistance protein [Meiothermus sp.]